MFKGERTQSSKLLRLSHVLWAMYRSLFFCQPDFLIALPNTVLVGEADRCRSVAVPSSNAEVRSGRWFLQVLN